MFENLNKDLSKVRWVKQFPVDSLQIYFAASLELQEELIKHGFQVPASRDKSIKTPVPIIYCNFRGWITEPEPITIERVIPPEWYGKTPSELGWKETKRGRRRAFRFPPEEVYVHVGFDDAGNMYFKLEIRGYHLERTSIRQRGLNPERWTNWAMFYMNANYIDQLMSIICDNVDKLTAVNLKDKYEQQQGGKERTYYAYKTGYENIGIPIKYFSFCLGCFDLALDYLRYKARETGINPSIVNQLKLRISYDQNVGGGLKVGVAKIKGKRPQIMFKLASTRKKITIKAILKDRVEGKRRGRLEYCSHTEKMKMLQFLVADANLIYGALSVTKKRLHML